MNLELIYCSPAETLIRFENGQGDGHVKIYETKLSTQFILLGAALSPEELRTISEKYRGMMNAVKSEEQNPKLQ